jgi:hypothetical protein
MAPPTTPTPPAAAAPSAPDWRLPILALALAAWAVALGRRSPVPSEDGVSYLWMAERFAAGDFAAATGPVFPVGYPLLLAPWCALGLAAETAAHLVGALALAATLWPLRTLARALGGDAAGSAAVLLFAAVPLLPRLAAECYSEPPFLLLMAHGAVAALRQRWPLVGVCAAAAFWIRPEGSLLAAAYALAAPRSAWRALPPVAVGVLALAALRWAAGHGFDPLPIHGFHQQRDDLPEQGRVLANLLATPGPWLEAFALAGVLCLPQLRWRDAKSRPLALQIALQVGVVATFVVRRRFFLSCAIPVCALAGAQLAALPVAWRRGLLAAALALGAWSGWNGGIDADRAVERDLGLWLRPRVAGGQPLVSDLPRVVWFAGQRPLPPRHHTAAQMQALVAAAQPAFVVVRTRSARAAFAEYEPWLRAGHAPVALPTELAAAAASRGIAVFARR